MVLEFAFFSLTVLYLYVDKYSDLKDSVSDCPQFGGVSKY